MKKILFIILPFPSHYTACFSYARYWQKKGYEVFFTGNKNLRELIEVEGFGFCSIQYLNEYNVKSYKSFLGLLIKTIVDKKFTLERFKEFYTAQKEAQQLYLEIHPKRIFIDEHLAEYFFSLENLT